MHREDATLGRRDDDWDASSGVSRRAWCMQNPGKCNDNAYTAWCNQHPSKCSDSR